MAHLTTGWHPVDHYLHAHLIDFRDTRQRLYVASLPANVRGMDPKDFHRRSIETSHLAVTSDHDDRDIDRVQDGNYIDAYRDRTRTRSLHLLGLTNSNLRYAGLSH